MALLFHDTGRRERAVNAARLGLEISTDHGYRRFEAWFESRLGYVGDDKDREGHLLRALEIVRTYGDAYIESGALNSLAEICIAGDRQGEAWQHVRGALDLVRKIGARREEGILMAKGGLILLRNGESAKAESLLSKSIEIGKKFGSSALPLAILGLLRGLSGKFDEGHALFDQAEKLMQRSNVPFYGLLLCFRGEVCVLQGDRERAIALSGQAEAILQRLEGSADSRLGRAIRHFHKLLEG
jgi:tetratricopeptide (TPR) repeat protein